VLAVFLLTFQGGLALGSAIWGLVAERVGISQALLWAGVGTVATLAVRGLARLPDATGDVSPWNHWRMPVVIGQCLVYAIYHSPLAFIRTLLEIGAEPNALGTFGGPLKIRGTTQGRPNVFVAYQRSSNHSAKTQSALVPTGSRASIRGPSPEP
jgi:hypothetical protein